MTSTRLKRTRRAAIASWAGSSCRKLSRGFREKHDMFTRCQCQFIPAVRMTRLVVLLGNSPVAEPVFATRFATHYFPFAALLVASHATIIIHGTAAATIIHVTVVATAHSDLKIRRVSYFGLIEK